MATKTKAPYQLIVRYNNRIRQRRLRYSFAEALMNARTAMKVADYYGEKLTHWEIKRRSDGRIIAQSK